ncbi:release factor glutamine methyltransferase [Ruminococcaceae bacterium YRB3002]|nr:release factor glutamine methyltransferase [Ruminococcaceae bacterium YRB3002]
MCGKDYPSQYTDGFADFYYERYKLTPGVLIPRPDTELLVEAALMLCGALSSPMGDVARLAPAPFVSPSLAKITLADLCAGTGCVGISVANALVRGGIGAEVTLVDISDDAMSCCRENAGVCKAHVNVVKGDILSSSFALDGKVDVITSNPPYVTDEEMTELPLSVTYEPELALRGGADGLDFYGRLCEIGAKSLVDGGVLAVEHGYRQQDEVMGIFGKYGYGNVTGLKDFGGNPRVVAGIWRG